MYYYDSIAVSLILEFQWHIILAHKLWWNMRIANKLHPHGSLKWFGFHHYLNAYTISWCDCYVKVHKFDRNQLYIGRENVYCFRFYTSLGSLLNAIWLFHISHFNNTISNHIFFHKIVNSTEWKFHVCRMKQKLLLTSEWLTKHEREYYYCACILHSENGSEYLNFETSWNSSTIYVFVQFVSQLTDWLDRKFMQIP